MSISELDYWRLADELSVVDAALLASGHNPGEVRPFGIDPASCPILTIRDDENFGRSERADQGFRAVFKALKRAITGNKIQASVCYRARLQHQIFDAGDSHWESPSPNEWQQKFEVMIRVSNEKRRYSFGDKDFFEQVETLHILREPDWYETTIAADDLKSWFAERGVYPEFFFPHGKAEGFRDQRDPRYAPKLACAVAAWEAMTHPKPNKSVKQSIADWVRSNGERFGMADDNGIVTGTAAEEVAKVVNWNPKGGATPTAIAQAEEAKRIENHTRLVGYASDPDEEITF